MALRFERKSPKIYTAFLKCVRTDTRGRKFKAQSAVRMIQEHDHWYTDKTTAVAGAWMPWESVIIDGRKRWRSQEDAAQALNQYARECGAEE
jgi:hypothetical protein